jgi:hypothetical protein
MAVITLPKKLPLLNLAKEARRLKKKGKLPVLRSLKDLR